MKLCVVTSILRVTHKFLYRADTRKAAHVGRDHRSVGSQLRTLAFGFLALLSFMGLSGCGVHSPATTSAVIGLAASSTSLAPGGSVQLKAKIAEPSGALEDVTSQVEWQTSNPATGSVSTSGIFTANEQGNTIISATLNGATGNLAISVGAPSVTALSLSPGGVSLAAGGLQQYVVSATYSNNTTGAVSGPVTWTVSPASVATVSSSGLLSALAPGAFTVSASIGSMTAVSNGTVKTPSVTALSLSPGGVSLAAGGLQQYVVSATYSNNTTGAVSGPVTWTVSPASVATVSSSGLLSALAPGAFTVSASIGSMTAVSNGTVKTPSVTALSLSPGGVSLAAGGLQQYVVSATYSNNTTGAVSGPVTWTVSPASVATVSSSGLLSALAPGAFTVSASIGSMTAVSNGTVKTPSVTALSLSPGGVSLAAGGLQQYVVSATYSNNTTGAVSGPVTWTVSPASVATVSSSGLLSALAPGAFTVSASIGSMTAIARGSIEGTSNIGAGTVNPYPIPVYAGVDLSSFPIFKVSTYAASGRGTTINCTANAGSTQLTCTGDIDFMPGQGIRVIGGGRSSAEAAITEQPLIYPQGNSTIGTHTYCYVVDTVDPLGGISEPSPQVCAVNQPDLALTTVYNNLGTTTSNVGPSPSFLWYSSEDGGPFLLIYVAQFTSGASDMGQRIGSRGGWPDVLPAANPNISKQEDLFSTVQAVAGNQITLADPLLSSVTSSIVDHDDTQAVENAILAGVQAGGGTVVFGPGTFNLRRPAFTYVVDNSYAYPPYTTDLALDPWWGGFSYLYIPNGSAGNIDFEGAGRSTVLVTAPDHGGAAYLLSVGNEQREGAIGTPILKMEEVAKGSTQITLADKADASILSPGDDIFIYSGTYGQTPDVDPTSVPDLHHYTELNTVASISGDAINLVYPTSKRYYDDGGSSWGLTKMPITPHNIELQHFNLDTFDTVVTPGDVIGELVNDVQINGTLSNGAFGGGYKRNVTIEHCQWSFGKGTTGWGQEDEYDEFTDLAFIENAISGYAAAGSEGPSGMAKIYATEGTSEVLFTGNTFDHVSLYADQTTEYFVQNNTFVDGIIAAGLAYAAHSNYAPLTQADRSFLSFDSQGAFSADHNTFSITSDFSPPWVIRAGDFAQGNISDNVISFAGKMSPAFMIATFNGTVLNNTLTILSPAVGNVIVLVPDESAETPMSTFVVQGNRTSAQIVAADILVTDSGFTDTNPVCIVNNTLQASQGAALYVAAADVNQACP